MTKDPAPLRARTLSAMDAVRHGFLTRQGGVSKGPFASLNCGLASGDAARQVAINRTRAAGAVAPEAAALCTVRQHHGSAVVVVEASWPDGAGPAADAMVTRAPGLILAVLTADCAPLLLADADAGVVGAVHAGWRGAVGGVVEAAVDAMTRLGARRERIAAALGPCIAQDSYEVGPEFPAVMEADDNPTDGLFAPAARRGHFLFDLAGYATRRLEAAGVGSVEVLGDDTCADSERFFSYRRSRLNGQYEFGVELSGISLAS